MPILRPSHMSHAVDRGRVEGRQILGSVREERRQKWSGQFPHKAG